MRVIERWVRNFPSNYEFHGTVELSAAPIYRNNRLPVVYAFVILSPRLRRCAQSSSNINRTTVFTECRIRFAPLCSRRQVIVPLNTSIYRRFSAPNCSRRRLTPSLYVSLASRRLPTVSFNDRLIIGNTWRSSFVPGSHGKAFSSSCPASL